MKRIIRIGAIAFCAFLGIWFWRSECALPTSTIKKPVIAIIQTMEHPALDQTRLGIIETLAQNNLEKDKDITLLFESAQGNPALALQIIQKFIGMKADIIIAIATTAAQAALQGTKDHKIPVLFVSVTDPVGSKILLSPTQPEGHVTGVTNYVDVKKQMETFKKITPIRELGVVYNPGEANSVSILESMQKVAGELHLKIVAAPAMKTSDVVTAAQSLVGKVQAIFINNDNTALAAFDSVVRVGKGSNIPVFVSDTDIVQKGALAALGADQYALGAQVADMLIRVRSGVSISQIPMETPKSVQLKLNMDVAQGLFLTFTNDIISQANRPDA